MKIAFTGGRNYGDVALVWQVLRGLTSDPTVIFHVGDANGADAIVRDFGHRHYKVFVADWDQYGKAAGPIRNGQLLEGVDMLVAFAGGIGTADCVRQAKERGIPVMQVPARKINQTHRSRS